MRFPHQKLIHWLSALAFAWSLFAPSLAHAFRVLADRDFLTMELCVADGSKQAISLDTDEPATTSDNCSYCVVQSELPAHLLTNLQFAIPLRPIPTPSLYLESAKKLFAGVKLPAQGPPSNHCI